MISVLSIGVVTRNTFYDCHSGIAHVCLTRKLTLRDRKRRARAVTVMGWRVRSLNRRGHDHSDVFGL